MFPIRLQALHQVLAEAGHGVLEHADRLQQVEADQGLVDIHLQMAACASGCHGAIETDYLGADHGHGFALGGIDFSRHDRAAGFVGGQPQLAQTCPGATPKQPHVVGDPEQGHRQQAKLAHRLNEGVMAGHHGEEVVSGTNLDAGDPAQLFCNGMAEARRRVQPRAHGGASQGKIAEADQTVFQPCLGLFELIPPCAHFIAQPQGHRILQMGAANLDDGHPGLSFGIQGPHQGIERRQQPVLQVLGRGDVDRCGKHIIGGLRPIDVVIRVNWGVAAEGGA